MRNITDLHESISRAMFYMATTEDKRQKEYWQLQINDMKADLAVIDLMDEIETKAQRQPYEVTTDDLSTIVGIIRDKKKFQVLELDRRWSWRAMDWLYYLKYKER